LIDWFPFRRTGAEDPFVARREQKRQRVEETKHNEEKNRKAHAKKDGKEQMPGTHPLVGFILLLLLCLFVKLYSSMNMLHEHDYAFGQCL
jgi:hypothetical protein